ncbi:MAG TPA: hypothetical protein VMR28_02275 [Candidatus Saccharimonadales bacterium]|nr:hypothetical protein [Candidatus Saccharimonadales bacterium]
MKKSAKHPIWFRKVRGSYLPANRQGWLTYIPYLAYLIGVLVFVLHGNYSFWLAVFIAVPNWVAASAILSWIAARRS